MILFIAQNAPIILEESKFWKGNSRDVYKYVIRWVVPCSPKIEMGESGLQSEWACVSKILSEISWNLPLYVRLRTSHDHNSLTANIYAEKYSHGFINLTKLVELLNLKIEKFPKFFKIGTGRSTEITFDHCFWRGPERNAFHAGRSKWSFKHDIKLTKHEVCDLLMANNENLQITCKIDVPAQNQTAHQFHKKLLETGYFSDCEVTSQEGVVTLVHSLFLAGSNKLQQAIDRGCTNHNLGLSTRGVAALLSYLYYKDLTAANDDLELMLELFKSAATYDIPHLWKEISELLIVKKLETKSALAVFEILVVSRKLESSSDLALRLIDIMLE